MEPQDTYRIIRMLHADHRTGTRLKRWHCASSVSNFVVQCTRVTIFLCAALSKEATVMVDVLTVHAAANIVTMYEWILGALQTTHFLTMNDYDDGNSFTDLNDGFNLFKHFWRKSHLISKLALTCDFKEEDIYKHNNQTKGKKIKKWIINNELNDTNTCTNTAIKKIKTYDLNVKRFHQPFIDQIIYCTLQSEM